MNDGLQKRLSGMEQLQPIAESAARADFEGYCECPLNTPSGHCEIMSESTLYHCFLSSHQIRPFWGDLLDLLVGYRYYLDIAELR